MLDSKDINKLISNGEGLQLDFKFQITSSAKIAKSIVAFANSVGGTLLIGVKDNGKIVGVDPDEELYMIEDALHHYIKPLPDYEIQPVQIDNKIVLAVQIMNGIEKPYFLKDEDKKWRCFIRQADENIAANFVWMEVQKKLRTKVNAHSTFSEAEQTLLNYLKDNEQITQSKFCSLAKIGHRKAAEYLVNLICLGVIQLHITKNSNFYSLCT